MVCCECAHLVIGEQGVSVDIVQVTLGGVGKAGGQLGHMLGSIQAQELQQPLLHLVSCCIPANHDRAHTVETMC